MSVPIFLLLLGYAWSGVVEDILKFNPFSEDRRYISSKKVKDSKGGNTKANSGVPSQILIGGYIKKGEEVYILLPKGNKFQLVKLGYDLGGYRILRLEGEHAVVETRDGKRKKVRLKYVKSKASAPKPGLPPPPGSGLRKPLKR
jgi:hypothetical protein